MKIALSKTCRAVIIPQSAVDELSPSAVGVLAYIMAGREIDVVAFASEVNELIASGYITEGARKERKKKQVKALAGDSKPFKDCTDIQDAYMKANGHPGVHMTAGEGKCLKTLLSRLREYAIADIRERGHAEPENTEDLPARYLKFLHMHGATMRDFDRTSLLKFSSMLGNLPSLTAHAREQERKSRQPKQESVPTIKTKSIYTDV